MRNYLMLITLILKAKKVKNKTDPQVRLNNSFLSNMLASDHVKHNVYGLI